MNDQLQDRTYLHDRHRLSHQQIDRWLGENRTKEFLPEKLKQLDAIKNFLFVTDLLTKNNISYICFKGVLLSLRIYNDPTIRISHDIDLLIDKKEISPVIDILTKNGFQLSGKSRWPQKKIQQELFVGAVHHLSFYNRKLNTCVEIHWKLLHKLPITEKKFQQIIAENITEIEFSGRTFPVFSLEFELLYLLIHGAWHAWIRLKWLADINDYPVQKLNLKRLEKLITQLHAWRIVGQINILANHFFNTQITFNREKRIPTYFIRYAFNSIKNDDAQHLTKELYDRLRYLWFLFPGVYYKYRVILSVFFRPGDLAEIDSSFRIMYYLYRPYSFIRRRILHV